MSGANVEDPRRRKPASTVAGEAFSKLIDSRRLLYFYTVAHSGSFTAAEAALDIAQSALSRQIRQLETELDAKLLERRGHGVEPTSTGRVLLKYATEVLDLMGEAVAQVNASTRAPRDRVSLAVSRPFSSTYVPEILSRFSRAWPQIHVSVYEGSSGQVYELLASGSVDLAVVLIQANSPKIQSRKLFDEDLYVVGRHDNSRLAACTHVKRADLPSLSLMLPAAPSGTRGLIERYFEEGGFDIDPVLRFDSVSLMKQMIRRESYCALLPRQSCEEELATGEFVARALRPALSRTVRLAHMRDHKQPEALAALRDTVVEVVAEMRGHQSAG